MDALDTEGFNTGAAAISNTNYAEATAIPRVAIHINDVGAGVGAAVAKRPNYNNGNIIGTSAKAVGIPAVNAPKCNIHIIHNNNNNDGEGTEDSDAVAI